MRNAERAGMMGVLGTRGSFGHAFFRGGVGELNTLSKYSSRISAFETSSLFFFCMAFL